MNKRNQSVLSSNLIAIKGSAAPAIDPVVTMLPPVEVEAKAPSANANPLNFRVTASFRRKFKTRAAENDLSLVELLYRSFEAWEREQGKL